ncbi:YibE/F family protein, partial [Georgenia ruanii]|nr:YibE/F family protein [Georgenia ruanii]
VVPLMVATVVGLVLLWPRGETPVRSVPVHAPGTSIEIGTVVDILEETGSAEFGMGGQVRVELETGQGAGHTVPAQVPPEVMANGVDVGDRMRLMVIPEALGTGSPYIFWDFERTVPVGWLALGYALAVLLVARWRGLAAMVGLGASLAVMVVFVLPALMLGHPPLLVALVGSAAMLFLSLYLAHGVSIRTTTALLGTFVGLAITVVLALWGTRAVNLTGTGSEQSLTLINAFPNLSLADLLLCGIVIAGLGALNDVTITQASTVWELHAANPALSRRRLFSQGMRVGRDHIASTVYTLAFAYVGTALPMLMLAALMDRSGLETLMSGEIAEEVVRSLVSSIGLVLAVPITTGIAALLAPNTPSTSSRTAQTGLAASGSTVGGQ